MYHLSCANTHHSITDLEPHRIVRSTKHGLSQERNMAYNIKRNFSKMELRNKKFLTCFLHGTHREALVLYWR